MGKSLQEIADMAAAWWGEAIQEPKFDNGPPSDGLACVLGPMMANTLVEDVPDPTKVKFVIRLAEVIREKIQHQVGAYSVISTDYGPDMTLGEIAEEFGIPATNFPWKTVMWISRNHVSVSYGYGAPEKVLYANKEHWRDKIKSTEESIAYYKNNNCEWLPAERKKKSIKALTKDIAEYQKLMSIAGE